MRKFINFALKLKITETKIAKKMKDTRTFRQLYYEEIALHGRGAGDAFLEKASSLVFKGKATIRSWICGTFRPNRLETVTLAEWLNADPDTLFSYEPQPQK